MFRRRGNSFLYDEQSSQACVKCPVHYPEYYRCMICIVVSIGTAVCTAVVGSAGEYASGSFLLATAPIVDDPRRYLV